MVSRKGECCGECVPKLCHYKNQTYHVGDIWKSDDSCLFYECAESFADSSVETKMVTFKKSCPALKDCPPKQIYFKDCCPICGPSQDSENDSNIFNFWDLSEKDRIFSKNTYLKHPCRRECVKNEAPKTCNYKFIVSARQLIKVFFFPKSVSVFVRLIFAD